MRSTNISHILNLSRGIAVLNADRENVRKSNMHFEFSTLVQARHKKSYK
jgi:hypothetical protein